MKDRILFWLDAELIHLFLAKFMQEKYDADYFSVADVNIPLKKYFQNQQMIHFEKMWFYRDHISLKMKKPDLNYLTKFESNYDINLWRISYNERNFYRFTKAHKFTDEEILWILEQECKLFEQIIGQSNPDYFILKTYNGHHAHLLYEMCKKRGVKTMILSETRYPDKTIIYSTFDKIDKTMKHPVNVHEENVSQDDLKKFIDEKFSKRQKDTLERGNFQASLLKRSEASIKFALFTNLKEYGEYFPNYKKTLFSIFKNKLRNKYGKYRNQRYFEKNALKQIPLDSPFVFYPLHVEPEKTISIYAPFHTNQFEIIHQIAKALPINCKLFVKEHPHQIYYDYGPKTTSFYESIRELPNVRLIHPSVSSKELIQRCSLVVTITGTVGLEAQFYGKPVIVFARPIYSSLSSVHKLNSYEELSDAIKLSLKKTVDPTELNKFNDFIENNFIDFSWEHLSLEVSKTFFYGGFSGETELSDMKIQSFIKKHKIILDKLSNEHIQKIHTYKKLNR